MRATSFCQRHFDDGYPRLVRRSGGTPLAGRPPDAWRVSRRPTHFGCKSVPAFRRGRFLPATSTDCDPLTLPSPRTACPLSSRTRRDWLSPIRGDPPARDGNREVSASTRPRPSAHDDAREGSPQVLMIRSAFHRTGDRSRLEGLPRRCVSLPRAAPVSRFAARIHDDDAVRPTSANDTIVSTTLRKVGSSLPRQAVQAHGQSCGDESLQAPSDFRRMEERR
jgi:hypothetical protein